MKHPLKERYVKEKIDHVQQPQSSLNRVSCRSDELRRELKSGNFLCGRVSLATAETHGKRVWKADGKDAVKSLGHSKMLVRAIEKRAFSSYACSPSELRVLHEDPKEPPG